MKLPYGWLISLNKDSFNYQVPKDDPVAYSRWEFEQGRLVWERFFKGRVDIEGKDVLDLGCGPGGKTNYLATLKPRRVVGVDFLPELLNEAELAKNVLAPPTDRIRLEFVLSNASDLPFPENYFDIVTCSDAMEHFTDPATVVREAARVLKPGGIFALDFAQWGSYNGHHLGDFFKTWWAQVLWSEEDLRKAVVELADLEKRNFVDSAARGKIDDLVKRRLDHFNNCLNHLSISAFEKIISSRSEFKTLWRKKTSAHPALWPFIFIPGIRELAVERNVYIFVKQGDVSAE